VHVVVRHDCCRRGAARLWPVFLVVGVFGISMMSSGRLPDDFTFTFARSARPIVAFALLVPNTPRRVLVSSLLAASARRWRWQSRQC
jgi:hypothetical protein